jgi:hypothetical protein
MKEKMKEMKKKPYIVPEVVCIAAEPCAIMATSEKTASNIYVEETEEDATPTDNTFNVW